MEFEYFYETTINASIDIDNINNCAISAFNDFGDEYIIVFKTNLGQTRMFEFGPIYPEAKESVREAFEIIYIKFDTDDKKIKKYINNFLNNSRRYITQALEISIEDALKMFPDILEVMKDD